VPSSTLSSWALLVWEELNARNLDANAIFRQAGLNPAKLSNTVARFPVRNMAQLWQLAQQAARSEEFGIAAGLRWNPTTFHALGFAWLASNSLGDALHRMARYGQFLNDGLKYRLVSEQVIYRFHIILDKNQYSDQEKYRSASASDAGIAALLKMCRLLMGDAFNPIEITCPHPPNSASLLLENLARCPVYYQSEQIEMVFDRHEVEQKLNTGNEELTQAHEQIILKHMAELHQQQLSAQVQLSIMERLPSGNIKESEVAAELGLSARTMQRRLLEEGVNYQGLLQQSRQKLADQYIRDDNLAISEIAYLLGFSAQANFTRAFKRWNGVSPTQYRNQSGAELIL
jgi:AraC-like DNA-binding protein